MIWIIVLFIPFPLSSQQFWNLTTEFWGGPKTGITILHDSIFIIGTTNSVMRSTSECDQLEQVLSASAIHTVFATKKGKILAGGTGKIFLSNDAGKNWDSVLVNTSYPLKQFVDNSAGELFAITGIYDDGDGVFYSGNGGADWQKRNYGLGSHLGCAKIAVGKNDRLYLAVNDENAFGYGGLLISENSGLDWQKVSVNVDSVSSSIKTGIITNLSVLQNDSVYLSFYGSGGNFGVELNIYKNIDDLNTSASWQVLNLKHNQTWGMDDAMNNIFVARNGDWYSSVSESIRLGGTCFSKDGKGWNMLDYGLGADIYSKRSEQFFAETPNGRIFMIQYLDERIYKTDTSFVTGIADPVRLDKDLLIFPNPVLKGEKITMQFGNMTEFAKVSISDLAGKKIYSGFACSNEDELTAPGKEGIYIVEVVEGEHKQTAKIMVE